MVAHQTAAGEITKEAFARVDSAPHKPRHTLKELRDQYVVKQELDYSCGAAALATLLTYYFGERTSEAEILKILQAQLTVDELRLKSMRGFSLLDLKRVAQSKGYRAAGFRLSTVELQQLAAPVIVFVQPLGYKHFAVLRGVSEGRVFLADPARGNIRMSIARFRGEWSGIIFALGKAGEEKLRDYPLSVVKRDEIMPELGPVSRMLDLSATVSDVAVRFQRR